MEHSRLRAKRIDTDANQVRIAIAGRASYFHGLVPQSDDIDKPDSAKSYKSAVLIPKDAPKSTLAIFAQAVKDAIEIGVQKKWKGIRPSSLNMPLSNGDLKAVDNPEKYAAYEGNWHFTAKRREDFGRPILKANGQKVENPGIIESGDWCIFDVNLYPYDNKSKGVAVALNGVTLIEEGERFGGGPSENDIDNVANGLYGDELVTSMGEGEADDLMGLLGGDESEDELMNMLN